MDTCKWCGEYQKLSGGFCRTECEEYYYTAEAN